MPRRSAAPNGSLHRGTDALRRLRFPFNDLDVRVRLCFFSEIESIRTPSFSTFSLKHVLPNLQNKGKWKGKRKRYSNKVEGPGVARKKNPTHMIGQNCYLNKSNNKTVLPLGRSEESNCHRTIISEEDAEMRDSLRLEPFRVARCHLRRSRGRGIRAR